MISGRQIRAARKLLGWTRTNLAKRVQIMTPYTIEKAEASGSPPTKAQARALRRALEAAGVEIPAITKGHETILAHLSRQVGFANVQEWASDPLVRFQLDQLCREARRARRGTVHRLAVSEH